ncbi:MAG TPA: 4'-phosphopantetheinyl transferase superfamily protein [Paraburkholderia sp.]|nr:4'-phosphopantetheinyl transferase superfamily protein [Paraburkholderia sp.]
MSTCPSPIRAIGRWPDDVSVWSVSVPSDPDTLLPMARSLDEAEQERASRFRQPADRGRFISARHALRVLLGGRVGEAPQALRFGYGRYGKPTLDGYPDLSFNVSHTGDYALIAMSAERIVGIDIERMDPAFDWQSLADLVCTGDEQHAIARLPSGQQAQSFFRCWTAKEALLKALGLGITEGLRAISVDPSGTGVQTPLVQRGAVAADAATLRFHWLHGMDGYVACIAFGEPGTAGLSSSLV